MAPLHKIRVRVLRLEGEGCESVGGLRSDSSWGSENRSDLEPTESSTPQPKKTERNNLFYTNLS